jgi:putative nucleotidyltransferase with HDIG domain
LPQRAYAIDVVAIWRHSAAAAATAGAIARNVEEPGGLAFTAGLLHDVGKIVLASAEGGKYGQLLEDLGQNGSSLEPIEAKFFGFGHGEIGGRLLERWGLPFDVSVPVRYHHRADWAAPFQRRCAIVSLSNCMAHAAESTKPEQRHYDSEEAIAAMRLLELTEESVGLIMQEARSDIKRFTGMKVAKTR